MPDFQDHLNEFRGHLEAFYASLKLAPPYNSIEKALTALASAYHSNTSEEKEHVNFDETIRQRLYQDAFVESGLYKKHRGIIAGLLRGPNSYVPAKEYQYLLQPFLK